MSDFDLPKIVELVGNAAKNAYDKIQKILNKKDEAIDSREMIEMQLEMNKFCQMTEAGSAFCSAANNANQSPARAIKGQ